MAQTRPEAVANVRRRRSPGPGEKKAGSRTDREQCQAGPRSRKSQLLAETKDNPWKQTGWEETEDRGWGQLQAPTPAPAGTQSGHRGRAGFSDRLQVPHTEQAIELEKRGGSSGTGEGVRCANKDVRGDRPAFQPSAPPGSRALGGQRVAPSRPSALYGSRQP